MQKARFGWFGFLIFVFLIVTMACGAVAPAPTATAAPTATQAPPTATGTATTPPTATVPPTQTPNVAATKEVEDFQAKVQSYIQAGYLSGANGDLYPLDDYRNEWAQMNYFSDLTSTGHNDAVKDFLFTGDFEWESAVANPETSGCGLYFRVQNNGNFYSAYLDTERVVMGGYDATIGPYIKRFGITTGTGRVKIAKPSKANFTLIMNGHMAYVLVDEKFIGSYTLFAEKLLDPGVLGYFVKSGTNKDFGTRCSITHAKLWVPKQ
jgi:hypothetical protein